MQYGEYYYNLIDRSIQSELTGDCLEDVSLALSGIIWEAPIGSDRAYAAALVAHFLIYLESAKDSEDMEQLAAHWLKEIKS